MESFDETHYAQITPTISELTPEIIIKLKSQKKHKKLSGGQIAGIVIGCVAFCVLVIVIVIVVVKKKKAKTLEKEKHQVVQENIKL
ncbi:hypothetical protein M9Y10_030119 [Tritrichomonas musculus]|uniref:Uncharacterized protein n=1 Tax=Tritrichomonas musculus TaxID=1915356 RepID=A0ABR2KNY4_9EUKA